MRADHGEIMTGCPQGCGRFGGMQKLDCADSRGEGRHDGMAAVD
jgi:hypothetical protein